MGSALERARWLWSNFLKARYEYVHYDRESMIECFGTAWEWTIMDGQPQKYLLISLTYSSGTHNQNLLSNIMPPSTTSLQPKFRRGWRCCTARGRRRHTPRTGSPSSVEGVLVKFVIFGSRLIFLLNLVVNSNVKWKHRHFEHWLVNIIWYAL